MKNSIINIVIAEPSFIISEGLAGILSVAGDQQFHIIKAEDLCDIVRIHPQTEIDVILINPSLVQNQQKLFNSLKRDLPDTQWAGLVYAFFDQHLMASFDGVIMINDTPGQIVGSIQKLLKTHLQPEQNHQTEALSEREIEVLKLLVEGNSNKEIADKLFISTHTVITHRKNISQKTGIKSVSGLTIYAVVNNIITLDNFS